VLSTIGGLIQFAPLWTPLTRWLNPVAPATIEATNLQEWLSSGIGMACGLAGIAVAWAIYSAKRTHAPAPVKLFLKKFYWDEAYEVLWYRPADLISRGLYAVVEQPLIGGSLSALAGGFGLGSRELGRAQNGLVRTYALALAGGLAVLAVVFLAAR
jgi:NADH-quinone oxidoreductase subunit L